MRGAGEQELRLKGSQVFFSDTLRLPVDPGAPVLVVSLLLGAETETAGRHARSAAGTRVTRQQIAFLDRRVREMGVDRIPALQGPHRMGGCFPVLDDHPFQQSVTLRVIVQLERNAGAGLYETFRQEEARRILDKIKFH